VFEQECTEQFAEALKRLEEAGVANETEVAFGDPADEILRVSTAEPYETVIIGRRGRGLSKMLLGSVSEKVLQKATIPVTVAD
jgi:nucleotide-binding universal stress UspA family protein